MINEVEKFKLISNIGFILSVIFLLIAIVLFFAFNIKKNIMDLLGITEKRAILKINEENILRGSEANNVTDKISRSGKINGISITSKIPTERINTNDKQNLGMETTLLSQSQHIQETTLLNQPQLELQGNSSGYLCTTQEIKNFIIIQDISFIQSEIVL